MGLKTNSLGAPGPFCTSRGVQKLTVTEETDRHRSFRTAAATDRQYRCRQGEGKAISDADPIIKHYIPLPNVLSMEDFMEAESANKAKELWNMVFSLFGVQRTMLSGVAVLLASWSSKSDRHKSAVIWSTIPHCLAWDIWWETNARTFEGSERSVHDLKLSLLYALLK
nr:hypothetical protein CFP56_35939 [Quercus suber]